MKDHFTEKFISFEILLDYIDGTLEVKEKEAIEAYLHKKPIDKAAVEGVKLIYDHKGMDRKELETYVAGMNISIPKNKAAASISSGIPYYVSTVVIAYMIIGLFFLVPVLSEGIDPIMLDEIAITGPFEIAQGSKMCP